MSKNKQNQATGTCAHCGQTRIIYLPDGKEADDYMQEELDRTATEQCDCAAALSQAEKDEQREKALTRMQQYYETLIKEIDPDEEDADRKIKRLERQQALMISVIADMTDDIIHAASVQIREAEVFTVSYKADGALRVKRTFKGAEEWIF